MLSHRDKTTVLCADSQSIQKMFTLSSLSMRDDKNRENNYLIDHLQSIFLKSQMQG